jgi:hypothetical protein
MRMRTGIPIQKKRRGAPRSMQHHGWSANPIPTQTPPQELYETLKSFKDRVAEDIKESGED